MGKRLPVGRSMRGDFETREIDGPDLFKKPVKTADMAVESYQPGCIDSVGLGYTNLKMTNCYGKMTGASASMWMFPCKMHWNSVGAVQQHGRRPQQPSTERPAVLGDGGAP